MLPHILCTFVVAVLMLLPYSAPLAQSATPARGTASTTVTAPSQVESEVRILQARLEDAQRHQDQMLATVWGALGIIATIAALLVGFGWFANVRMYERDKAALEQSLRATLLDEQRRAREEVTSSLQQSSEALRAELNSGVERIRAESMTELDAASKRVSAQFETQARALKSGIAELKQDTLKLQMQDALHQREDAVRTKVWRNALQDSITALEIAKQIDDGGYSVGEVLDLVAMDIDAILADPSCRVDNFLIAQVVEELGTIKGSHSAAASALRAMATAMKMGG